VSGSPPVPPGRVPTLTEVVVWPENSATTASHGAFPVDSPVDSPVSETFEPVQSEPVKTEPAQSGLAQAQLTERVLADVQRQIDLMLDYRLREALTPLLSRMADHIVRDARTELASTLREVVSQAVAQELSRHRVR
jgi:hypothetical protein